MKTKNFYKLSTLSLLFILFIPPAYAYAGPGVAIGAILVAITVVIAFFGSLIIKIFNLIMNFLRYINRKLKSRKNIKKRQKKRNNK